MSSCQRSEEGNCGAVRFSFPSLVLLLLRDGHREGVVSFGSCGCVLEKKYHIFNAFSALDSVYAFRLLPPAC